MSKKKRIARIRELRPEKNADGTHKIRTGSLFKSDVPGNFIDVCVEAGASDVHLKHDACATERVQEAHDNGMVRRKKTAFHCACVFFFHNLINSLQSYDCCRVQWHGLEVRQV